MVTQRAWTAVEEIALQQLLEHLGLPTTDLDTAFEEDAVEPMQRGRKWTKAQRAAHSKRMKAFWRGRKHGR